MTKNIKKTIISDIFDIIKIERSKNNENYEYVTLEEFILSSLNISSVQQDIIDSGMKEKNIPLLQEILEKRLKSLNKQKSNDYNLSESLDFVLKSVTAKAMNIDKDVKFKDILKVIMVSKSKDDSEKCKIMKEIFERFDVSLELLLESEHNIFSINENETDNEKDGEVSEGYRMAKKELNDQNVNINDFILELTSEKNVKKLSPAIGREEYRELIAQSLSKKKKSALILVGHPGTGKSAIVEDFSLAIYNDEIPVFEGYSVIQLDISKIVSGSKYRGDVEKRFNAFIDHIKSKKCIVFIDDIHSIRTAGSNSDNDQSIGVLLKNVLDNGEIKLIGITNYEEKRKKIDTDKSLSRRFETINVEEMNIEEAIKVVSGKIEQYATYHGVKYESGVVRKVVETSSRFITDKKLPDKAFDIIDQIGALKKIKGFKVVKEKDVDIAIAKMAHIPVENISSSDLDALLELENNLNNKVFGQEFAIENLVNEIMIAKSNIGENGKKKPIGSFLFAGSTGVGKTEVVNELSRQLNMNMIRLDMSEYMEKHAISKIIGAPAGYVGYDAGSSFLKRISDSPYSVVLLDEIEKAHPDIQNIFLQVLDNGFMSDANGNMIDFRNTIIVLTTNVGANVSNKGTLGFVSGQAVDNENKISKIKKELERSFKPEFRNRLDHIIYFNSLSEEMAYKITNKKLEGIIQDLKYHHDINIEFDEGLIKKIASTVFEEDNKMGARPIDRKIKILISKNLSLAIIKKEIIRHDDIVVSIVENKITLTKKYNKTKEYETRVIEEINKTF